MDYVRKKRTKKDYMYGKWKVTSINCMELVLQHTNRPLFFSFFFVKLKSFFNGWMEKQKYVIIHHFNSIKLVNRDFMIKLYIGILKPQII